LVSWSRNGVYAGRADVLWQGLLLLERLKVAGDGVVGAPEVGADGGEFSLVVAGEAGGAAAQGGDGDGEQVGAVVGGQQRVQDGGFQFVGWEAFGGAGGGAEAVAGEAGVVAVALASAVGEVQ